MIHEGGSAVAEFNRPPVTLEKPLLGKSLPLFVETAFPSGEFDDHEAQDECGVFGVWAPGEPVGTITYIAGIMQEHRGLSATGIGYRDPRSQEMVVLKGLGRVMHALPEMWPVEGKTIAEAIGSDMALLHNRYSTQPDDSVEMAHPHIGKRTGVTVIVNGNLEGIKSIAAQRGLELPEDTTDSYDLTQLIDQALAENGEIESALKDAFKDVRGAYCVVMAYGNTIVGYMDAWGVHPLKLATFNGGKHAAIASEAVAFAGIDHELTVRDFNPGEAVIINSDGVRSVQIMQPQKKQRCIIESVYTAAPHEVTFGAHNAMARYNMGKKLAHVAPVKADLVIPVPSSGIPAAKGYSVESGIPYKEILRKRSGATRTFILRGPARDKMLDSKFEIDEEALNYPELKVIKAEINELVRLGDLSESQRDSLNALIDAQALLGLILVVVDDSAIKGNTIRKLNRALKAAGAKEVHWRLAAMPTTHPCNQGLDTGNPHELLALKETPEGLVVRTNEEMAAALSTDEASVDSIAFNKFADVESAIDEARVDPHTPSLLGTFCQGCAHGVYEIKIPASVAKERRRRAARVLAAATQA